MFHDPRGPLVAVTDQVFDQLAIGVDQPVINAPAVNADTLDGPPEPSRGLRRRIQPGFDVRKYTLQIPAQTPMASPRWIMKPVHFLKRQFARGDSDQKDAPTAGAEIN